jgi:hypothetical protein
MDSQDGGRSRSVRVSVEKSGSRHQVAEVATLAERGFLQTCAEFALRVVW